MAGEIKLVINQLVTIDECEYEFQRLVSPRDQSVTSEARRDLQFMEVRTGHVIALSHDEFDRWFSDRRITIPCPMDRIGDEIPEDEENEADSELRSRRLSLLREFDENPVGKGDESLAIFLADAGKKLRIDPTNLPAPSTFRTHLRERGVPGDRRRKNMGRRREPNGRLKRLDPIVERVIAKESEIYFKRIGIKPKDIYAAARYEVGQLNQERKQNGLAPLRPAGRTTVWRRLLSNTTYENAKRRLGSRKAKLLLKPHQNYMYPDEILEVVIIDDTRVDCHVIDENETTDDGKLLVIGRPNITVAIDSYSRCAIGYVIGFSDPSVETAMACLRNLVRPKRDLSERLALRGTFPWGGLPQTILYDRAWGNVGSSMLNALADIGVSMQAAPIATPEYKGRIERFFDTLNSRLFHTLPGAVPFKPNKMKDHELEPIYEAKLTLPQLERLTVQALIDYNNDEHTGLGDVPARLWNARAKNGIQYPPDLLALDMACAKLAPKRVLSSKGIESFGLRYCSGAIGDLLTDMWPTAPRRNHREGTVPVKVKYLPEDISAVFVWNTARRTASWRRLEG